MGQDLSLRGNNPFTYVLTTTKLDAMGYQWLAALAGFCFCLKYCPGVGDRDANALTRRIYDSEVPKEEWTQLNSVVQALCQGIKYRARGVTGAIAI